MLGRSAGIALEIAPLERPKNSESKYIFGKISNFEYKKKQVELKKKFENKMMKKNRKFQKSQYFPKKSNFDF